jgi:hypothetical protein
MNAFCASENFEASSSSAPPSQGKIPRKTLAPNGPIFGEQITPIREGAIAGSTTILCVRLLWIGNVEEVGDLILNRQKSLCLPGCEPLYDPFPSSCRLVRILRAIVHPFVLAVFDDEPHLCPRGAVGTELVRDHHARRRRG